MSRGENKPSACSQLEARLGEAAALVHGRPKPKVYFKEPDEPIIGGIGWIPELAQIVRRIADWRRLTWQFAAGDAGSKRLHPNQSPRRDCGPDRKARDKMTGARCEADQDGTFKRRYFTGNATLAVLRWHPAIATSLVFAFMNGCQGLPDPDHREMI